MSYLDKDDFDATAVGLGYVAHFDWQDSAGL